MGYSAETSASLVSEHASAQSDLERLFLTAVQVGQSLTDERAKEYMLHGAARRLKLLRRCLANVFQLFPPSRTTPIGTDDLDEVQISLHAFVMNLYGLFENLAWSFVLRHSLEAEIGNRKRIGMFLKTTQQYLPAILKNYLTAPTMVAWHDNYLKNYRDSLAHRIPLYIPPATYTPEEGQQYQSLKQSEMKCILTQQWVRLEQIRSEQDALGSSCPMFLHSFADNEQPKPLYLHPQMLCDVKTVLDFCPLFFANWNERA